VHVVNLNTFSLVKLSGPVYFIDSVTEPSEGRGNPPLPPQYYVEGIIYTLRGFSFFKNSTKIIT
jgi:hypothetical protein